MGRTDFSDQFRKVTIRYKLIGYILNVMRQSVCLGINPIRVNNFAVLFNWTPVDRASDFNNGPELNLFILVGWDRISLRERLHTHKVFAEDQCF